MWSELLIGLLGMLLLYWLGHIIYPEEKHQGIIPEPNNLLVPYGEAVGQIYGDESE